MNQKLDTVLPVVQIKLIVKLQDFFLPGTRKSQGIRKKIIFLNIFLQLSGLTFSRGCCEIKDGSPTCPENNGQDDYEFNDGINHGRYFRCTEELLVCNFRVKF